jgi:hypothetical protein
VACAASSPTPIAAPTATTPAASVAPAPRIAPYKRFRSKRFNVSLPLPNGPEWRIDDHSRPELVATHAATGSSVVLYLVTEEELTSRQICEERAREQHLVPAAELRTIEDTHGIAFDEYDTRTWVAVEPAGGPDKPLVGHVFAFGGFLRKCLFFHYTTSVKTEKDEPELSGRLATARTRILGGLVLSPFASAPREKLPVPQ